MANFSYYFFNPAIAHNSQLKQLFNSNVHYVVKAHGRWSPLVRPWNEITGVKLWILPIYRKSDGLLFILHEDSVRKESADSFTNKKISNAFSLIHVF